VRQGELIGYVLEPRKPIVRVVVPQIKVDLIRQRTTDVSLLFADKVTETVKGKILREIPGALEELPSMTLSTAGGGKIAIDPSTGSLATFDKMFQFDVEPDIIRKETYIGERVYIKFYLGHETLAFQWYRNIRQLFLKRFNV
jgi:putative peptide zinc metalloprotease protein